jgi:hypothetical protein
MLQYFGANNQIEHIVFEWQAGDIGGGQSPPAAAVFTQPFMKLHSISGFAKVIYIVVSTNNGNFLKLKDGRSVAPCSTADIQYAVPGSDFELLEINGDHEWPLDIP